MKRICSVILLFVIGLDVRCVSASVAAGVTVEFAIDMRGPIAKGWFDPASETVGVRGNASPLSWSVSLPAHDADHDGQYRLVVAFPSPPSKGIVAYKFKVDGRDNPNDGWETGPNRPLVVDRPRVSIARDFDGTPIDFPHTITGDVRLHARFASRFVAPRDVNVLLPAGYDQDRSRRYPVVYMHDGQNLFDSSRSSGAEWRVDETMLSLIRARVVEPIIVVGINSLAESRIDDYTPVRGAFGPEANRTEAGGNADKYGRFLVEELKPFIDVSYRTRPDVANTGLGGSSLGGLVTMYLGLRYPRTFGKLMVVSPSVWWADEFIVKEVGRRDAKPDLRIWLDIGSDEGDEATTGARHLRDALVAKGWALGRDLRYVEAPHARHDESAWAARFGAMVRFLFPRRR
jgi:predicted alpha/beta superfamily hydrolase